MSYFTPLRYPGGKRRLVDTVCRLLRHNGLYDFDYVEPFAGSAAIGLALLIEGEVNAIHLNDLDPAIYALWVTIVEENDWLCRRVGRMDVTVRQWRKQRAILELGERAERRDLGLATLFLNRTNRSGILSGGIIGGQAQTGAWKIDARFSKEELVRRIRQIGRFAPMIHIYNMDASDFVSKVTPRIKNRTFTFFDPPYIENGKGLYLNDFDIDDHVALSDRIMRMKGHWVVTYDYAAVGHGLFKDKKRIVYDLKYTAQGRYAGREVMFFSDALSLPPLTKLISDTMHPIKNLGRTRE